MKQPLENKLIISTRPLSDDDSIKSALIGKGAVVLDFPMIKIVTNELNTEIRTALANISSYNWLLFTSKNGVDSFFRLLQNNQSEKPVELPKIAVIGKTTASEVVKNGFQPAFVSAGNTSEDFIAELQQKLTLNDKLLLALGELADAKFENALAATATLTRINVYKTIETQINSAEIIQCIKRDAYDLLVFTSPSGFRNFVKVMNENDCRNNFRIACIGKTTEREVLKQGYTPLIVSAKSSGDFFSNEIENYFIKYTH
ncbi:MAG: uroporphyrinogen-III synthase [Paludibacter sp.]|nr:uroporphyrinogen-III synthase [Paludibacter sp.]